MRSNYYQMMDTLYVYSCPYCNVRKTRTTFIVENKNCYDCRNTGFWCTKNISILICDLLEIYNNEE